MYVRRLRTICCEIYKTLQGTNAKYMIDLLSKRPSLYPSRSPHDLFLPKANQKTFGYNSFKIEAPRIWNMLPRKIRELDTLYQFKMEIRKFECPWCKCEKCLMQQTLHILS